MAGSNYLNVGRVLSLAVDADGPRSIKPRYGEIWPGTKPVPKPKGLSTPVGAKEDWSEGLSRKPQAGGIDDGNICLRSNKVFGYNLDGYIDSACEDFTTDYDVLSDIQYVPDIADETPVNVSVDANQTVIGHSLKCLTTSFGKVSFGVSHSLKELSRQRSRWDIVKANQKIRFHDILPVMRSHRDLASMVPHR